MSLPRHMLPTVSQQLLLRMLFGPQEEALLHWTEWCARFPLDEVDLPTRDLLPVLHFQWGTELAAHPLSGKLAGIRRYTWSEQQIARQLLKEACDCLEAAGLHSIVISSAALARRCYPEPGLRSVRALHLLLSESYLFAAVERLSTIGWIPRTSTPAVIREEHVLAHSVYVLRGKGPLLLHLHRHIRPYAPSDGSGTWQAIELESEYGAIRVLDPAWQLLQICDEAEDRGNAASALWVPDMIFLLRSEPAMDWERVLSLAAASGTTLALRDRVEFLQQFLGFAIPPRAMERLRRARVSHREMRLSLLRRTPPPRRNLVWLLRRHAFLFQAWHCRVSGHLPRPLAYLRDYYGLERGIDVFKHLFSMLRRRKASEHKRRQ